MNPMSGMYSEKSEEQVILEREQAASRVAEIQAQLGKLAKSDPQRPGLVVELQQITPHLRELNKELKRRRNSSKPGHQIQGMADLIPEGSIQREDLFAAFAMHALLLRRGEEQGLNDEALARKAWDMAGWMEEFGEEL